VTTYISVISMCQCVYLMLLLLYMFKILKKMNIFCFNVCRGFPIFCRLLPKRFFPDPRRLFAVANLINTGCNVPTLGHHHIAEVYDDQSSHMDVIENTGIIERHFGISLALFTPSHHYDPFCTGWLWFRCIPTISMI
jgi:hypothetical protein